MDKRYLKDPTKYTAILTQKELAEAARTHSATISAYIKRGIITPRRKIARGRGRNYFTLDDLQKVLDHMYPVRENYRETTGRYAKKPRKAK